MTFSQCKDSEDFYTSPDFCTPEVGKYTVCMNLVGGLVVSFCEYACVVTE